MGGGQAAGVPQMPISNNSNSFMINPDNTTGLQIAQTQRVEDQSQEDLGQSNGQPASQFVDLQASYPSRPTWTKVGGLSLPIDIPTGDHSVGFSRVGGEAKLALQIRSRELVDTGVGMVWTLVWLGIAGTLIVAFSRVSNARELVHPAVWILFVGGLLSFLILPGGFSGLGFVGFLLGLLALASRFVRAGRAA